MSRRTLLYAATVRAATAGTTPPPDPGGGGGTTSPPPIIADRFTTPRDPWEWPFDDGIYTYPIGSGATLVDAKLTAPTSGAKVYPDLIYGIKAASTDPAANVYVPYAWNNRDGSGVGGFTPTLSNTLPHFPNAYTFLDADQSGNLNNNHHIVLDSDGDTLRHIGALARIAAGANIFGYIYGAHYATSIRAAMSYGTHASQLDPYGLCIKPWEMQGPGAIRHPLGLEFNEELNYNNIAPYYVSPAISADALASTTYGLDKPAGLPAGMMIGALLTFDSTLKPSDIGVVTDAGQRIFYGLMFYGGYACESVGNRTWNAMNLSMRSDAVGTFQFDQVVRDEIARMVPALKLVTNNVGGNAGGGATRRQPLAPLFIGGGGGGGGGGTPPPSNVLITGNLLTIDEQNFEGGLGSWSNYQNGTLSNPTDWAADDTHSMAIDSIAAGDVGNITGAKAVAASTSYTASLVARAKTAGRNRIVGIQWLTAGGVFISNSFGAAAADSAGANAQPFVTATSPATAGLAKVIDLTQATGAAAERHYTDRACLRTNPALP